MGGDLRAMAQERFCTPAGVPDSSLPHGLEVGLVPKPVDFCGNRRPCDPGAQDRAVGM